MKKVFLLIMALFLSGCVETNVIEVKESFDYTSELIGEIELYDSNSDYSIIFEGKNLLYVNEFYMDNPVRYYQFDLTTNEISEINEIENDEIIEGTETLRNYLFIGEFNIFKIANQKDHIYTKTYYYEKDGEVTKLIEEVIDLSDKTYEPYKLTYDSDGKNVYFYVEKNDYMSINQVIDGQLEEIDQVPLIDQGIELLYIEALDEGVCYHYENDEMIRRIINDEELIVKKKEGNKKLISWEIEGLNPKKLVYEEDNIVTLQLENEVYKLGFNSSFEIQDDYILYTNWKDDFSEKETFYIDREENKTYLLSEYFDLTYSYLDNIYVSYLPNDQENPYKIINVNHKDISMISLPFTSDFSFNCIVDEHVFIFSYKEGNVLQFYKVTF